MWNWGGGIAAAHGVSVLEQWGTGSLGSVAKPSHSWGGKRYPERGCSLNPRICFGLGLFLVLKQQEAPHQELGRQGVSLGNDLPPD